MNPIGYHHYLASRAERLDPNPRSGEAARSITDTAGRNHDMALGVLLMTIVAGLPVLLVAMFLLLFRL